ncbi:hypothetical protein FNH08_10480 [Streptomyces spongiae]|uniref:Uncharacterized protein n=2 Tax=Streptomyces spongiae TaxID=565072 RepID=A0A5N8XDL7_9ACTN|nr:hypothetical protein [Streptomyces spongiae]
MTMLLRTPTHAAPLPVLRAAVFAVVGTVLGVSAHHLVADGPAPWLPGAAAVVVLFGVGLAGARRPRSLAMVVATCGTAQVGLHQWLTATGVAHHAAAMGASGHGRHGMTPPDSLAMTAVHAAAAILVAVLLHRADVACWFLTRGLVEAVDSVRARIATVRALLGDRPAAAEPGLPTPVRAWLERPPPEGAVLADVVVRRGPPRAGLTLVH